MTALGILATRLGRHTAIYVAATGSALLLGLVQVGVLTRLLDIAVFGQLAVLLVCSTLLTVVYNLGTLQGSMRYVFGASADDVEDGAVAEADEAPDAPVGDKRRALGTALAIITLITALATVAIAIVAPTVAELLLGEGALAGAVVWMAVAAALGSIWRVVTYVLRMERRPTTFAIVAATRPVLVVAAVTPLAIVGRGVDDVMAGIAIGTALSLTVGLIVTRQSYSLTFSGEDASAILRRGWDFVPIVMGVWVIHNADVLMLSGWVPDADLGIYRVASRVGAVVLYVMSAFLMAWGPLSRTPLFAAVERERTTASAGAVVVTYFVLGMMAAVLVLAVLADVLVKLAPPAYSAAAVLIPLVGIGFALTGVMMLVYRVAKFPGKRLAFICMILASAVVLIAASQVLIPPLGNLGAALSLSIGPLVGLGMVMWLSQRGPTPMELEYGRMAAAGGLALACFGAAKAGGLLPAPLGPVAEVSALLAFPALLVALRVVPPAHVAVLRAAGRALLPERAAAHQLRATLAELPERSYALLRKLVHERQDEHRVARLADVPDRTIQAALVAALREACGLPAADPDPRLGACLLSTRPVAERDEHLRRICEESDDPLEIDMLVLTFERLRALPAAAWSRATPGSAAAALSVGQPGSFTPTRAA